MRVRGGRKRVVGMRRGVIGSGPRRSACLRADERGQATVEAAYLVPAVFLCLLLLLQPGIILYDYAVMEAAAADGCRLLATKTDVAGASRDACEAFVKRRLAAVPPQDQFHLHGGACSWEIDVEGDETSEYVQVTIKNKLKLLPLIDAGGTLLGIADASGAYPLEVTSRMRTQPQWAAQSEFGLSPQSWVGDDRL